MSRHTKEAVTAALARVRPITVVGPTAGPTGITGNYSVLSQSAKRGKFWPYRNALERDYAFHLDGRKQQGEISDWKYEAVKLKIGETRCWWTPDFFVLRGAFCAEFHECKGFMRQHARVKLESAKRQYPWARFVLVRREKGEWRFEK